MGTERATWQTRGSDVTESGFMTASRHGYLRPPDPRLRLKYTVPRQLSAVILQGLWLQRFLLNVISEDLARVCDGPGHFSPLAERSAVKNTWPVLRLRVY